MFKTVTHAPTSIAVSLCNDFCSFLVEVLSEKPEECTNEAVFAYETMARVVKVAESILDYNTASVDSV